MGLLVPSRKSGMLGGTPSFLLLKGVSGTPSRRPSRRASGGGRNPGRRKHPPVAPRCHDHGPGQPAFSGCMGLYGRFFTFFAQTASGAQRRPPRRRLGRRGDRPGMGPAVRPIATCGDARELPTRRAGAGRAQIAGDRADPGGAATMFPGVAIAARRAAALAAVHPAAMPAPHRRGAAQVARAGAGATARGGGEDGGLCGNGGWVLHGDAPRWGAARASLMVSTTDPLSGKSREMKEQNKNAIGVMMRAGVSDGPIGQCVVIMPLTFGAKCGGSVGQRLAGLGDRRLGQDAQRDRRHTLFRACLCASRLRAGSPCGGALSGRALNVQLRP